MTKALKNLKTRREAIVSRLVRLRGYVDSVDKDNLSENIIAQLTSRLERVQTDWEDFNDIQTNIEITEPLPLISFDKRNLNIPEKFMLADSIYNLMGDIDILLGAQVFWSILGVGNEHFNEITLQNTELGWVVAGTLNFSTPKPNISVNHLNINMHDSIDDKITKFWQLEEAMVQQHWTRWQREYLSELQVRTKWRQTSQQRLKIGTLVLVRNDNLCTLNWQLGRITSLHPGKDQVIRVVGVKVRGGEVTRAVNRICALPIEESE
ncbi:hypothetical protein ILUMI_27518 [Ignelater luminosus]|uniref:DUF5641 domain-containing protein n=1 Tax=Ignelater luminosus TaxID=2038154 RepID=A0A8K0C7S2_IGNLU|nr:hypothetical protein ILUMI_27518 [Ignelater luminosus]